MRIWQRGLLRRINILVGSVRSGKTWISLVLWAFFIAESPPGSRFLMTAKTLTSLRRNCLDLLETLIGKENFKYSLSKKEAEIFGRLVYLEGVNDSRAEHKIRGMTLSGAYCDELTLFTEDFFTILLQRLSAPGAKLIATTNPDNPNHWLKTKYIDRLNELDMMVYQFLISDNTFLDAEYIKNLKLEHTGVFYSRYIDGLWIAAEGVIYKTFADDPARFAVDTVPLLRMVNIGVDFGGTKSGTAFVATGFSDDKVITLKSTKITSEINPEQLGRMFMNFAEPFLIYNIPITAYCDNAEPILIRGLKNAAAGTRIKVANALKSPILERIRLVSQLINCGNLLYMRTGCEPFLKAMSDALWNSKKENDERLDDGSTDIDTLDAFEYAIEREARRFVRGNYEFDR